ncbi:SPOR domain-containing protein [Bradyrhizobium sp.]|uniref:SPOR domain-containing protein n=1 Tax=Bradyrhizobium sp. TaxID=376 RepID=UPI00260F31D0|nr:SPOR domain-containing protein [Bradyrhizobium sp.]
MADRYQNRAYPAGDGYDRGAGSRGPGNAESDPLAELARLIGQTDPFGTRPMSRANLPTQPPARPSEPGPAEGDYQDGDPDGYQDSYYEASEPEEVPPPAPPSWMQRAATRQEAPPAPREDDYPNAVHPLHRYAAAHPPAEPDYDHAQYDHGQYDHGQYDHGKSFAEPSHEADPSRYDEALYGSFDSGTQHAQHDQGYGDDGYGYEDDQQFEDQPEPKRRGDMIKVAAVLALAVFGVGGAFAYRTYTGRVRSGEPPIIRADTGPTKIIPAQADATAKVPDRMAISDGTEKIVSREETPMDPGSARQPGPRVVFPPLTQNGNAPLPATITPGGPAPAAGSPNGTFTNNEPHQVRTVTVRQDAANSGTPPAAAPPAAAPARPSSRTAAASPIRPSAGNPNAANANGPLSLAPQGEASAAPEPPVRMAATNPTQMVPSAPSPAAAGGGYLVQVSSQSSEAEAQASYKMLQSKYPSVLRSHAPVIRRAELSGDKVVYRAMVGPFGSSAEASQFCGSLKSAGGQCLIHRN